MKREDIDQAKILQLGEVGVALGGGGAKGLSHIGVLKAFEQHNIKISKVAGTSIGAIIGSLYCNGYSANEIHNIFASEKLSSGFGIDLFNGGLANLKGLQKLLLKYIPHNSFAQLKIPMHVTATNINTGKLKIISRGDGLTDWIVASASIPIAFAPKTINECSFVDGGLLMNLPAEPLIVDCDTIFGANVIPLLRRQEVTSAKKVAERVFVLTIEQNARSSKTFCDYIIEMPESSNYSMWDFNKLDEIVELGYQKATQVLEEQVFAL